MCTVHIFMYILNMENWLRKAFNLTRFRKDLQPKRLSFEGADWNLLDDDSTAIFHFHFHMYAPMNLCA